MERLPRELMLMIFSKLDLIDLIDKKCVCKRWLHLINQINFKELVIINQNRSVDSFWFHIYKPLSIKFMLIDYLNLHHFDYESFRNNFHNLQFFKINYLIEDNLEQLNHFPRLVHLEIDNLPRLSEDKILNLKFLKVFKFQSGLFKGRIIVNSNHLEILCLVNLNQIKPLDLNLLKYIEVDYCNESNQKLDQLNNLEILVYKKIGLNQDFSSLELPYNIKQLHFYSYDSVYSQEDLNKMRKVFLSILGILMNYQRKGLNSLQVFFEGIELFQYKIRFEDYGFDLRNDLVYDYTLKLIQKNYDNTADILPEYCNINYIDLENAFVNIPDNFFQKFNLITCVYANQSVLDLEKFALFLKNCEKLSRLGLFCLELDQKFLDQLCNYSMKEFNLEFDLTEENKLINYEFLFKFNALFKFKTTQNLSLNFIMQLMYKLRFLKDLEFYCSDKLVKIKKTDKDLYDLKIGRKEYSTKYFSYPDILIEELFDLINKL